MGHELVGEVVAAAAGSEGFVGRRVAVNPQVPCGVCLSCRSGLENVCQDRELVGGTRPGGFGELVAVPVRCVHLVDEGLDPELAVLAEPVVDRGGRRVTGTATNSPKPPGRLPPTS